uniref:Uncharacterized protein n=1 Tax=Octopus bimaculoides TaxID=37653 RepID=A0A0L8FW56_OCTBM
MSWPMFIIIIFRFSFVEILGYECRVGVYFKISTYTLAVSSVLNTRSTAFRSCNAGYQLSPSQIE